MTHEIQAEAIRAAAYAAYRNAVFTAAVSEHSKKYIEAVGSPKIGDTVVELTTIYAEPAIEAVGVLVAVSAAGAVIETLDGREVRWADCQLVRVIPVEEHKLLHS